MLHTFGLSRPIITYESEMFFSQLFRKALELCLKSYGESSVLSGRLHWNMFVLYEERGEYQEAHTWLVKCKEIREKVGLKRKWDFICGAKHMIFLIYYKFY